MSKRYIYSGIISSLCFCGIYLYFQFYLVISILISIVIFIAFVLIYREKDIRKYDPKLMMNYSYQVSRIYNLANAFSDSDLQKRALKITETAEKIFTLLENKPNKVEQGYNFFDYYLNITLKILMQYQTIKNNELVDNDKQLVKLAEHIKKIEIAFEKQLRNMHQDNMLDMESEIRVFEKTLKMDGFIDTMKDVNLDGKE